MNTDINLSTQEILTNYHFQHAQVIAGDSGLYKQVKWVRMVESTTVDHLLGHELILATNIDNEDTFLQFIHKLIDLQVTGLCIELESSVTNIPMSIIQFANEQHFPIIVFKKVASFIDIIQDLHTFILNKQYNIVSDLENYSNQLNQLLLTSSNIEQQVLNLLYKTVNQTIIYIPIKGQKQILSTKTQLEQEKLLKTIEVENKENIAHKSIRTLNQTFANLYLVSEFDTISNFETLILDRTATALAQYTLRLLYFEEQQKSAETKWISKWLNGGHSEEQILRYLSTNIDESTPDGCVILILKNQELHAENTHIKALFRSIFQSLGFTILITKENNQIIFILINKQNRKNWKKRVEDGIDQLNLLSDYQLKVSIGKFQKNLIDLKRSYETAQETLFIQRNIPEECTSYFYEDLFIYRLISLTNDNGVLIEFIHDHLGKILDYDKENSGNLLDTLRTYLMCNGSKQETSTKLFIVRQTLYQRLQKLNNILGDDFMAFHKRQAIEFAITAYDYLNMEKNNRI